MVNSAGHVHFSGHSSGQRTLLFLRVACPAGLSRCSRPTRKSPWAPESALAVRSLLVALGELVVGSGCTPERAVAGETAVHGAPGFGVAAGQARRRTAGSLA